MPKTVLGLAAKNIGDDVQVVFLLEQAIYNQESFTGSKDCYDEFLRFTTELLCDELIQARDQLTSKPLKIF